MIPFWRRHLEGVAKLEEHNRLLTEAATDRARKLQEREAEFAEILTERDHQFAKLEEHNRLLTAAATESAHKLQEREAELTRALGVMSQRVARLSEHNRWLAETAMEAASEFQGWDEDFKYLKEREQKPRYCPQQMRVLMVTSALSRGGCERQILATAVGLLRQGYQIEIFCFAAVKGEPDFTDEFARIGINCHHPTSLRVAGGADARDVQGLQKFAHLVDHLDVIAIGTALANAIREFRPEIVHCWSDFANVVGGLTSTNLGVPKIVLGQRNVPAFRYVDGTAPYVCREAYRLLAQNPRVSMLNNSSAGLTRYAKWLGIPKENIKLVYNGFLPEGIHIRNRTEAEMCRRHLGVSKDVQVVGAVMRFAAEKDPHLWLETAAAIAAARPSVHFVLAGYGDLAEQVEHRIQALGLAQKFILPGATKDVGLIYGALDVFLMTSRFEGTPNVLIEAQAAGVPIVAPNVGGTNESLVGGMSGIIVDDRRASTLASAALQILDDRSWRERAAAHGPAFVSKRFGHSRMVNETTAVYDSVANEAQIPAPRSLSH